ncbi:MAG: septal ring lytic transglycosylase RlpA family protein [Alphaproteobacteria bacterium]|nr:septal ring lytic transglycosylase RlpA family protein [Alphaproteobacteria bacterium]
MRTIIVALVSLVTFAMIGAGTASAGWKCNGPSYACNSNSYSAVKKARAYKKKRVYKKKRTAKKVYKKKRYSKKGYRKSKKRYTKRSYKKRSKKYAKRKYKKSRYAGRTLYGKASFYWQPQRVASGGWFNPNAMTAAHKSLRFGTRVRVTNKYNGRSVTVRINDRGPYIKGRIIDLSKAAAYKIGMQHKGVVPVTVKVLN